MILCGRIGTPGRRAPQAPPLFAAHHLNLPILMVGAARPGAPSRAPLGAAFPPSAPRGPQGSLGVPSVMHVNSRNIRIYLILNLMVVRKTQIRGGQVTRQRTMQAPFKVEREALAV